MSTIGDETTYVFKYLDTPTDELETITHFVHIEKGEIPADDECEVPADTDKKSLSEILAAKKNQKSEAKPETATSHTIHIDHRTRQVKEVPSEEIDASSEESSTSLEKTDLASNSADTSSDTLNVPNLEK